MNKQAYCTKPENVQRFLTLAKHVRRPLNENQAVFITNFLNSANEFINSDTEEQKALNVILVISAFQKRAEADLSFLKTVKSLRRFNDNEGIEIMKKILRIERKYYNNIISHQSNGNILNNEIHDPENLLNTITSALELKTRLQYRLKRIEELKISSN